MFQITDRSYRCGSPPLSGEPVGQVGDTSSMLAENALFDADQATSPDMHPPLRYVKKEGICSASLAFQAAAYLLQVDPAASVRQQHTFLLP